MFVLGKCFQSASDHRRSTLCPVVMIHNPLLSLVNCCTWLCFKQGVIQISLPTVVKILLKANVGPAGQHLTMPCTCLSTLDWKNEQDHLVRGICDYQGNTLGKMCTREVMSMLDKTQDWCAHGCRLFHGKISVNLEVWKLPKSYRDFSQKQDQGYELFPCAPDAVFAGHLQLIGVDLQRLYGLSLTSIQKQLVRATHYSNVQKSLNSPG